MRKGYLRPADVEIAGLKPGDRAKIGTTLRAKPMSRSWTPNVWKFTYQWRLDGKKISGATGQKYTPKKWQHNKKISVTIRGAKPGYYGKKVTTDWARVSKPFSSTSRPVIKGSLRVGETVRAKVVEDWKPTAWAYKYQWFADGEPIAGATSKRYTLTKAEHGTRLKVKVTGKRQAYLLTSRSSRWTSAVRWPDGVSTPRITGNPNDRYVLSGTKIWFTGSATGGELTYQWQRRTAETGIWKNMKGRTSRTLAMTAKSFRTLDEYRLRVRNAAGTKYTRPATLWVDSLESDPYYTGKIFVGSWYLFQAASKTSDFTVGDTPYVGTELWICPLSGYTGNPATEVSFQYVGSGWSTTAFGYSMETEGGCELFWVEASVSSHTAARDGVWQVYDDSRGPDGSYAPITQWMKGLQ
ncbi:hypothetical protein [Isoptericola haloaureus]|uniref:Ig-like domain-containing protein n=1 Tax=Isoptericola haloaureus TaxID=1542902 RepID=A0ABU7ZAV3_9MICO